MAAFGRPASTAAIFLTVGLLAFGSYTLVAVATTQETWSEYRIQLKSSIIWLDFEEQEVEEFEEMPLEMPRRLDGVVVPTEQANEVPICVMIENAAFGGVRPQSGLAAASVVYEVVVEGGITRFMAVFAGGESETVGPVRSARDTYLEFVSELNGAYVHAGGSYTAMLALQEFGLRDIDALREYSYFWRDPAKVAPHNLFTSTESLKQAVGDHHWEDEPAPSYDAWTFETLDAGEPGPEAAGETATSVQVLFGGAYTAEFRYDEEDNSYPRMNGGVAHTDAVTGEQLAPRTIIIQHVGEGIPIEGKGRVNWPVTGSGDVEIFHSGKRYAGTWEKQNRLSRTRFFDEQGSPIPLSPGQLWVVIVPEHIETIVEDATP